MSLGEEPVEERMFQVVLAFIFLLVFTNFPLQVVSTFIAIKKNSDIMPVNEGDKQACLVELLAPGKCLTQQYLLHMAGL